jgi:citrate lyase beta subunit
MLFMPGNDLRKIEKGAASGVDCVIMDLEDGVAFSQKDAARQTIRQALETLDFGKAEKLVRINPVGSALEIDDLKQTIEGKPDGYVIPKVESLEHIRLVDLWLSDQEQLHGWEPGRTKLFALIESAMGVVNIHEITQSSSRLQALIFGAEDLAGSIGAVRTPAMSEVSAARSLLVIYAKAYNLQAIDTPYIDIHNLEGLKAEAETARQMGYDGKLAIHPTHLPIIEAAFTPSTEEVERAQHLIAAFDTHQESGTGVFVFEGKMVDMPMIRSARNVLARADEG